MEKSTFNKIERILFGIVVLFVLLNTFQNIYEMEIHKYLYLTGLYVASIAFIGITILWILKWLKKWR